MKSKQHFKNKHLGIVYRHESSEALAKAKEIANWLHELKVSVYSPSGKRLGSFVKSLEKPSVIANLNLLVVLGGDGTYLRAANLLQGEAIPMLGINMGSLGFLTETRVVEAYKAILHFLEGKMEMQHRSLLKITCLKKNKTKKIHYALNDAVIERGGDFHLVNFGINFEKQLICEVKADGIIVATPTGSTAYNLAAGGPLIYPQSDVFAITPLNPHSLTMRPLVVPNNRKIHIKILSREANATLTIDGQAVEEVSSSDEILFERGEREHVIVYEPGQNYFDVLRDKLKFGQRD